MAYQIISDGSCDLPPELARQKNIHVVPFYVSFDGVHYKKEIEEVNIREFYQEMIDRPGVYPKSSLPSVQDYINAFTPYVSQGHSNPVHLYQYQIQRIQGICKKRRGYTLRDLSGLSDSRYRRRYEHGAAGTSGPGGRLLQRFWRIL